MTRDIHSTSNMKRVPLNQKGPKTTKRRKTTAKASSHQPIIIGPPNQAFKPEMKSVDSFGVGIPIGQGTGSAGHNILLNGLVLGAERYNRIGRKTQTKKIHINVNLKPPVPEAATAGETIVMMLVVDLDAGSSVTLGSLLQDVNNLGVLNENVCSNRNLNTSSRFKILRKEIIPLRHYGQIDSGWEPATGGVGQFSKDLLNFSWHVDTDVFTQFNQTNDGTLASIENGAIWFCYWTDQAAIEAPTTLFDIHARLRYYD